MKAAKEVSASGDTHTRHQQHEAQNGCHIVNFSL